MGKCCLQLIWEGQTSRNRVRYFFPINFGGGKEQAHGRQFKVSASANSEIKYSQFSLSATNQCLKLAVDTKFVVAKHIFPIRINGKVFQLRPTLPTSCIFRGWEKCFPHKDQWYSGLTETHVPLPYVYIDYMCMQAMYP